MQQIISRQLSRAAFRSKVLLAAPIDLREPLEAVIRSLQKVYGDKGLDFRLEMDADQQVRIDQADLYEVLGNLLDNASKWAQGRVEVVVEREDDTVSISIRDDGPGFPAEAAKLLERGLRADMQQEGQGLGLAMASEIASAAGGGLVIDDSADSGGHVRLRLPSA
jgi:two-component system sensor histidine kinase PhoQ